MPAPRWWTIRAARNLKPATYRCPFCNRYLPSLSDHMLIAPEGDTTHRRHAHIDCVRAARAAGQLPTIDEWRATRPRGQSFLGRLRERRFKPR
jgi:hypothetical protein